MRTSSRTRAIWSNGSAGQPWRNGNVGVAIRILQKTYRLSGAGRRVVFFKATFLHEGWTDMYRHVAWHENYQNELQELYEDNGFRKYARTHAYC